MKRLVELTQPILHSKGREIDPQPSIVINKLKLNEDRRDKFGKKMQRDASKQSALNNDGH